MDASTTLCRAQSRLERPPTWQLGLLCAALAAGCAESTRGGARREEDAGLAPPLPAEAGVYRGDDREAGAGPILDAGPETDAAPEPAYAPDATARSDAAALDEEPVGACGPLARLPGVVGFAAVPCGQPVAWLSPTFLYEGLRTLDPSPAVTLKGGDGVVVAAQFQAGAEFRSVFARLDARGDCQELIGSVTDDDAHFVIEARTRGHGTVLQTGCLSGRCEPSLRVAGRTYELVRDLGMDEALSTSRAPLQIPHEIALAQDGRIVIVTSLSHPIFGWQPGTLPDRLMVRVLSPDLQLLKSAELTLHGSLDDIALTDEGDLLVLVNRPNQGASHHLERFGSDFADLGEVFADTLDTRRNVPIEVEFGRIAIAAKNLVVLEATGHQKLPINPTPVREAPAYIAFDWLAADRLLVGTPSALALCTADATPVWSYALPALDMAPPTTPSKAMVQMQSDQRIFATTPWQLVSFCAP